MGADLLGLLLMMLVGYPIAKGAGNLIDAGSRKLFGDPELKLAKLQAELTNQGAESQRAAMRQLISENRGEQSAQRQISGLQALASAEGSNAAALGNARSEFGAAALEGGPALAPSDMFDLSKVLGFPG